MNDATNANAPRKVKAWYKGQRLSNDRKLGYYWQYEGEGEGDNTTRAFIKSIAPALIGEPWQLTMIGDSVSLAPADKPVKLSALLHPDSTKWEAEHAAHVEAHSEYKADERLKKRKSEFERALEPLRNMCLALRTSDDKAAFIRRVTRELWRR